LVTAGLTKAFAPSDKAVFRWVSVAFDVGLASMTPVTEMVEESGVVVILLLRTFVESTQKSESSGGGLPR